MKCEMKDRVFFLSSKKRVAGKIGALGKKGKSMRSDFAIVSCNEFHVLAAAELSEHVEYSVVGPHAK